MIIFTLRVLFTFIMFTMLVVTTSASLHENILQIPKVVLGDPWFIATMFDAYFGFITFYAWVFYRSPKWYSRVLWFVLIMALGNMAMALYMLILLFRLPRDASMQDVLLRPQTAKRIP